MKVTFTLKNLSDIWYEGIRTMSDAERFAYLCKQANGGDLSLYIKQKVASGQFRDKVELNQIMRTNPGFVYKLEPRRGYMLATFEVVKGKI
jgi:hypothetical protein